MSKWSITDEIEEKLNSWDKFTLWHNLGALNDIDDYYYLTIRDYLEFDPKRFIVLRLRYLDGLSYIEIANKLNYSERTIYRKRNEELAQIKLDLLGDFN